MWSLHFIISMAVSFSHKNLKGTSHPRAGERGMLSFLFPSYLRRLFSRAGLPSHSMYALSFKHIISWHLSPCRLGRARKAQELAALRLAAASARWAQPSEGGGQPAAGNLR